jgi:hypothetical protein
MLVADAEAATWEYVWLRPRLDPLRFALAKRLDDLAYSAGLWWAARPSGGALDPPVREEWDHDRRIA